MKYDNNIEIIKTLEDENGYIMTCENYKNREIQFYFRHKDYVYQLYCFSVEYNKENLCYIKCLMYNNFEEYKSEYKRRMKVWESQ